MAGKAASRRSGTAARSGAGGWLSAGRVRWVQWIFLFSFGAVAWRLVWMQVAPDPRFNDEEFVHEGQRDIPMPRGDIYDNSQRLLATNRPSFTLTADPQCVRDPETLASRLAPILHMGKRELVARLTRRDENGSKMKSVRLKRWLTDSELQALHGVMKAVGPALRFERESVRVYPEGELAAHVIGFANRDGVGAAGVELAYDSYLRGIPGLVRGRVSGGSRVFLGTGSQEYIAPRGGEEVYLTINAAIQFDLEQELDKALVSSKAPEAMGMVMDPRTGAILALASRPTFNPNEYWKATPNELVNRAVVDVFEPGSSFKIVTASAALEYGLITPDTLINCENGSFNPYGHRVRDYHPMGIVPFSKCFAESSNIALIKVGAMLGPARLAKWIRRFGFGERTCKDFRGESRGIFRPRSEWSKLSMGSLPMGQEIAVTMPQLARAFSVIANGGYLVNPYLVESVEDRDGMITYQHEASHGVRILSEQTAKTMQQLCRLVVLEGTGQRANIPEYRVGGKTGTAQVAGPNGGYMPGKFNAVFAGFAPLADPWLVAVIVVEQPAIREHYGGYICAPVFRKVVRDSLIMMNCPPDPVKGYHPPPTADSYKEGTDGGAGDDSNDDSTKAPHVTMAFLETSPGQIQVKKGQLELVEHNSKLSYGGQGLPDFHGMTKRQAQVQVASLGLNWDPQGAGWVVEQDPPPGTPINEVSLCRLVFSDKRTDPSPTKSHDTHTAAKPSRM